MGFLDSIEQFLVAGCAIGPDLTVTEGELADAYGAFCVASDVCLAPLGFFLRVVEKSSRGIRRDGPRFVGLQLRLEEANVPPRACGRARLLAPPPDRGLPSRAATAAAR